MKPQCTNCGHEIEFLTPASGEVWGGFAENPDLPPPVDGDRYKGMWYWEFWVYMPGTHAVRGDRAERIEIEPTPPA